MKTKIATLLAVALVSFSAQAQDSKSVVLQDGTAASVYVTNGAVTTYVKSADVGSDGKSVLVQGEVFDGIRLAKTSTGRCVKVVDRLVRMDEVVTGGGKIQLPVTQRIEEAVSCGS